jgi:hypothetical protein
MSELCKTCWGVGHIEVKPNQLGWLRRPDLEDDRYRARRIQVYETAAGNIEVLQTPVHLRVLCPKCKNRDKPEPLQNAVKTGFSFFKR